MSEVRLPFATKQDVDEGLHRRPLSDSNARHEAADGLSAFRQRWPSRRTFGDHPAVMAPVPNGGSGALSSVVSDPKNSPPCSTAADHASAHDGPSEMAMHSHQLQVESCRPEQAETRAAGLIRVRPHDSRIARRSKAYRQLDTGARRCRSGQRRPDDGYDSEWPSGSAASVVGGSRSLRGLCLLSASGSISHILLLKILLPSHGIMYDGPSGAAARLSRWSTKDSRNFSPGCALRAGPAGPGLWDQSRPEALDAGQSR
jgi:hypothetical protein